VDSSWRNAMVHFQENLCSEESQSSLPRTQLARRTREGPDAVFPGRHPE
jgi:hypothetical protein